MERLRDWALKLIIALNVIALVVSFGESFAGLFQWAHHHSITGLSAAVWPLMIDVIVLVGEAGLFVAHKDRWRVRDKVWLWFITLVALGVSTAANVGHVVSTDWLSHLTASLPPVALFFSMTVGFGVMKRVYLNKTPLVIGPARDLSAAELADYSERLERETGKRGLAGETWIPMYPAKSTVMAPVSAGETPKNPPAETSAPVIPDPASDPDATRVQPGFKVTPKSYTMNRDAREGLSLLEKRVRDMYDVDPDISVNAIAKALGIAWATADKHLRATKEAREVTA